MQQMKEMLSRVNISDVQSALNLSVFALRTDERSDLSYLTLAEAVAANLAEVRETSLSGSVPEILLDNRADKPILILDGEELVGAKQNRTVNITILAPAGKTTSIPVTCIEAGRWSSGPMNFKVAERMHYSRGRARKMENVSAAMAMSESRRASQYEVWDEIAQKSERMHVRSATGALSDVFEHHSARVDDYVRGLSAAEDQTGAIFAIDGRIEGLELFDSPATFKSMFGKLIRSYALDALETAGRPSPVPSEYDASAFVETLVNAESRLYPAVGLGDELRVSNDYVVAGGLIVDKTLVHLVAFKKQRQSASPRPSRSEFLRASQRRRHRENR